MANVKKYSVDELLNGMRYEAIGIVRRCKNTFEVDELVNEAWIAGVNSDLPSKYQRLKRAKWDMEHYVRTRLGRKIMVKGEEADRPVFFTNIEGYEEHGIDTNIDRVDTHEFLDFLVYKNSMCTLKPIEKEIIESYYLKEMKLKEIGEKLDISEGSVSYMLKKALKECREEAQWILS
jgi:RNA polymerase sigma factor (sigma-70 family)